VLIRCALVRWNGQEHFRLPSAHRSTILGSPSIEEREREICLPIAVGATRNDENEITKAAVRVQTAPSVFP